MFEPLVVGGKVEVFNKNRHVSDDMADKEMFLSQIIDLKDDSIICTMPVSKGKLIVLETGTLLEAFFYAGKNLYRADCVIRSRGKEGNIFTMELELKSSLVKFQRREYFRLECTIQADVITLTDDEKKEFIDTGKVPVNLLMSEDKGVIVDISGGGLRLFSKKQFEQGSIVNIIFTINVNGKEKKMSLAAKVVLSVLGQNYDNVYDNRMQFVNIRKEDTDDIVKYVFAQQRLMQQRERGL